MFRSRKLRSSQASELEIGSSKKQQKAIGLRSHVGLSQLKGHMELKQCFGTHKIQ